MNLPLPTKLHAIILACFSLPTLISACPEITATTAANSENEQDWPDHYQQAPASPDGIGKFYMGREIAKVMGHQGIAWLERDAREQEENPQQLIAALNLDQNAIIADIGAGSGYYTFRLAPLVPNGKVIATDIQPEMLEFIELRNKELHVKNVETKLGTIENTGLEPNSVDAVLLVDAYHEFSHPKEMLDSIHNALRPGGKLFLIEYRAEDPNVPIKPLHKMSEKQAIKEVEAANLTHLKTNDSLPWQHLLIFTKPSEP